MVYPNGGDTWKENLMDIVNSIHYTALNITGSESTGLTEEGL